MFVAHLNNLPVALHKVVLNEADFMQEKVENWVLVKHCHVICIAQCSKVQSNSTKTNA